MHCTTSARKQDKFTTSSLTSQETCNNECHTNVSKIAKESFQAIIFGLDDFSHFLSSCLSLEDTLIIILTQQHSLFIQNVQYYSSYPSSLSILFPCTIFVSNRIKIHRVILCENFMFNISFSCCRHSVSNTFVQLTEGRSARDQPKQPPAKKSFSGSSWRHVFPWRFHLWLCEPGNDHMAAYLLGGVRFLDDRCVPLF